MGEGDVFVGGIKQVQATSLINAVYQAIQEPLGDITYAANTTLTADVYARNVTINSGKTITSNGFNFYCTGTFTNNGTINTGNHTVAASFSNGGENFANSYGGSGGGSGAYGSSITLAAGNGSTPTAPTVTNALVYQWIVSGANNYLQGGDGFRGGAQSANSSGGANGILIVANSIITGTINATGLTPSGGGAGGGSGGSGGGAVVLAYNGGYTSGTVTVTGGSGEAGQAGGSAQANGIAGGNTVNTGGAAGTSSGNGTTGGTGGNGGAGQLITYQWSTPIMPLVNKLDANPANPASTTSTVAAGVMMGLGVTGYQQAGGLSLTPNRSGAVRVTIRGLGQTAVAATTFAIQPYHGTGAAPTNGAAATGTADATQDTYKGVAAATAVQWMFIYTLTGLTLGTQYWFDVSLNTGAGADAASITNIFAKIEEI